MSSKKGKFLLWCTRLAVKDEFKLSGHIIKDVVYNREGQLTWFSPRLFLLQWLWPILLNLKPKSLHLISEFHPNLSGVKTMRSNDFVVLEFYYLIYYPKSQGFKPGIYEAWAASWVWPKWKNFQLSYFQKIWPKKHHIPQIEYHIMKNITLVFRSFLYWRLNVKNIFSKWLACTTNRGAAMVEGGRLCPTHYCPPG